MFSEQNRFLVVAAHPDDEVLSIGGILARARDANIEVAVQFLGEGISARFDPEDFGNDDYERAMKTRMDGAKAALDLLGIDKVRFENQYCCRFDRLDILDLVKMVELQIADFNPTHIFTHNPVEVNIDHRITYRVVETATRPKPGLALREVYSFEIWKDDHLVYFSSKYSENQKNNLKYTIPNSVYENISVYCKK